MSIYAIADPHLSLSTNKPMDIFGREWTQHDKKIESAWRELVKEDDTVIIPGDISWAMTLADAEPDLCFLHDLPGKKIISKGNHDYWWGTMGKLENFIQEKGFHSLHFMKNNAFVEQDAVICGTRGWISPGDPDFKEEDKVIYNREFERLRRSLDIGKSLSEGTSLRKIAVLHYPPLLYPPKTTPVTELLEQYDVDICLYGHLHGFGLRHGFNGERNGVSYRLVSADFLSFTPQKI